MKTKLPDWVCKGNFCPHIDCRDERGKDPICKICNKSVDFADIFYKVSGKGIVAAHITCAK